jgi:hypothetical protein
MNTRTMAFAALALVAGASSACPFCKERKVGVFFGDVALMGNGTARSWVDIGSDGKPKALGLTFNDAALQNLPEHGQDGMEPEWLLKLPKQAASTPFNHIAINWNPHGHEPKGIYDVPHFDFHFYMISPPERGQITLEGGDLKVCQRRIPQAELPKDYIYAPKTETKYMGAHYADVTSPEFNGKPFTSTFIYGGYDGRLIFIEPMTTMATIQTHETVIKQVKLPKVVEKPGLYPTRYVVKYDAARSETTVKFDGFVWLGKKVVGKRAKLLKSAKVSGKKG